MRRYNPKEIEPKWQKIWDETNIYTANLQSDKPKYIAMSMFNYPSGAGIHIGHAMNYTISDVKARFKRQQGYESYHPVGWDAFGLPAENYAIKAGVSPQESMATIIPSYHKQYKAMGWSNDWQKEIATHTPEYYKWTQWIFSQMYKNGLAYQDARMQWWCDKCQTVLANEQVIDGKCWRHDGSDDPDVEKKEVKQWFFKITEYADELLAAIDELDWTDSVKLAQKNWIGKSKGAEIEFTLVNSDDGQKTEDTRSAIKVFTTRPDTLFGVTFLVLAPEHELVDEITTESQKSEVQAYVKQAQTKSDIERQENKQKSGVFTGAYAVNPVNDEQIPIWVADYVLPGYGTGAIMAVPAHDERDFGFAQKFNLDVVNVVRGGAANEFSVTDNFEDTSDEAVHKRLGLSAAPHTGEGLLVNSGAYENMLSYEAREKIVADLAKKGVAKEKVNYKMRDWSVSRQRYWGAPIPIVNCEQCGTVLVPDEDLPVVLPELTDFQPSGDGRSALARAKDWLTVDCPECGGSAERETDTLDTYICSSWYMLRYFDPHNQEKIFESDVANKWMPIDFYNGGDHATAHMLYARFVTRFFSKIGLIENPEPFKQFLFNGKVRANDGSAFSKSKGNGVDPLEVINSGYGADALRMYLMFAAPLEIDARWDPKGVPGTFRFLTRLWNLVQEYQQATEGELSEQDTKRLLGPMHVMLKKTTADIEHNHYNTAIASVMAGLNELYGQREGLVKNSAWQQALEMIVACSAPFAPHIADELWQQLGHDSSVHKDSWPQLDESYLTSDTIKIVVQVNGRVRATIEVSADATKEDILAEAKANKKVASYLANGSIKKEIYVPGKLVNFVV